MGIEMLRIGKSAVVRNADGGLHDAAKRVHEPFGLAWRQVQDLADEQGGFYREIGIFLRPATGSGLGGAPWGERLFGEPNRDIATLAPRFVLFWPGCHPVIR